MKFVYFLMMVGAGFICVKYNKYITENTFRFQSVEKFLGPGGTYTAWKIIGVGIIGFAFYYLFNL